MDQAVHPAVSTRETGQQSGSVLGFDRLGFLLLVDTLDLPSRLSCVAALSFAGDADAFHDAVSSGHRIRRCAAAAAASRFQPAPEVAIGKDFTTTVFGFNLQVAKRKGSEERSMPPTGVLCRV